MNLTVVPNPYTSLDADGDPCGYVHRVDLRALSSKPILLGAERYLKDGRVKIRVSPDPVEIPDLPAYRRMLKTGELLPVDEATSRRAGLPWVPLEERLAKHRAAAAVRHQAHHGERPSWADPTPTPVEAP